MADEKPLPTLDSISTQITALATQVQDLSASVDRRFDETVAQLGVRIEAVDDKVTRVYDAVLAFQAKNEAHDTGHAECASRLNNHDLRILALERSKPAKP